MLPIVQPAVSLFGASLGPGNLAFQDMAMQAPGGPAESLAGLGAATGALSGISGASSVAAPAPFGDLLVEAVGEVQSLEAQAKTSIEGLISGKGVDVHEAMIAAQKAGMGFELALAVRNKALSAYQQVMSMQF
jgi:flagellar hook-basal body complex protein FliE